MSVNPIPGVSSLSALQQPTTARIAAGTAPVTTATAAAQTAPTADAAQAWEDAMRAAMGDETAPATSSDPLSALGGQTPTAAARTPAASTTPLTAQALAALVSGTPTAPTDPLVTSLSAPIDATTPPSDAAAGSFV